MKTSEAKSSLGHSKFIILDYLERHTDEVFTYEELRNILAKNNKESGIRFGFYNLPEGYIIKYRGITVVGTPEAIKKLRR